MSFLPNITELYSKGSTSALGTARGQMPSVSAPNWSSIICGMGPIETGVYSNDWVPADANIPADNIVEKMPPISGAGKVE